MRKIMFFMILLLFSINTSSWAQTDTLPNDLGKKVVTADGLKNVIDSKDSRFVIVDIRPRAAYDIGHIPTAINIPSGLTSNVENPPPKDKYIILYCFGGLTSPAAGEKMIANGYKYILVWGGINSWPYELEKSK
jgi:rhodanese-related sulfurtransferase